MKLSERNGPPDWAIQFLEWFCPDELVEGILGDLLEQYQEDRHFFDQRKADRMFIWNVIRFFHPSILLRNHLPLNLLTMSMVKSHLLVAIRSMRKYKFYAAVNILGLSLAVGFAFLAFLFLKNELAIDQFHRQKDAIFRVYHKNVNTETGQVSNISAVTAIPLAKDLHEAVPAIREFTRIGSSSGTVRKENTPFAEKISFVDTGFMKMFDFPLLQKDGTSVFDGPGSVVISEEKAKKFFGEGNPIGQPLDIDINDTTITVLVTGVIDAKSSTSSIQFGILLPFRQFNTVVPEFMLNSYNYGIVENYILLDPDQAATEIEALLTQAIQKYSSPDETRLELGVQPLSCIHLDDAITGNAQFTSPRKLYIMAGLALLVLLIAAINFIILSTSHGLNRTREMGLRKTLGAFRFQLRSQLLVESIFITLIAGSLGLLLAVYFTPIFSKLIESTMKFSIDLAGFLFFLSLTIVIGLITGIFQAIVLVRHQTVEALRGNLSLTGKNSWFNQGLMVVQFSLAVILIIGAVNIRRQMEFIQNKDLGFDKERLLEISMGDSPDPEKAQQLVARFRNASMKDKHILKVSASMNNTREPWTQIVIEQEDGSRESLFYNQVDPAYLETMGIDLVAGRGFSATSGVKSNGILVNEALVDHFGWTEPLKQQIPGKNFTDPHRILGVVEDFHFSSLHHQIEPLILALDADNTVASGITGLSTYVWPPNLYQLEVRIGPGEITPIIDHLKEVWTKVNPDKDFVYHFVDEVLEAKYAEEKRWAKIINLGSLFAIGIAWFGLLGLMRLSVQKRTKEIGIRKVLGSSTRGIILLLSKRFLLLVILGILIAWPVAWFLTSRWLQSFTYRISLSPLWFVAGGIGVLLITITSVWIQSLRAARVNPAETLNRN